mgnify:CR=1 FL=1
MSARLVLHSFRLLFRNFAEALKVSVAPLILAVLLGVAAFSVSGVTPAMIAMASFTGRMPPNGLLAILFIGMVMLFTFSWIAVAWHRFVLLEEYPGYVPAVTDRPIWPYVWRTLGLGLLMFMVMTFLSIIVGMILPMTGEGGLGVAAMLVGTALTYFWLRSALILPAVAVGEDLKLRDAWSVSASQSRAIFGVALILVGLNLMASVVQQAVVPPGAVAVIISLAVGWITLMVGASILTTLYGHLVQNRPLP